MGNGANEMSTRRHFPRSRTPSLLGFVACASFLAYAVYFVFVVGFDTASTEYRRGLLLYGCCVVALPFCGVAAALFARAVFKRDNGVVVDDQGVHDQLSFNGKILWPNILGVEQLKPDSDSSAFVLRLKDRDGYFRHRWTKPFVARGKDELMIYGLGLSSAAEILAVIQTGIRAANISGKNS
jgi:hypothetical protein